MKHHNCSITETKYIHSDKDDSYIQWYKKNMQTVSLPQGVVKTMFKSNHRLETVSDKIGVLQGKRA